MDTKKTFNKIAQNGVFWPKLVRITQNCLKLSFLTKIGQYHSKSPQNWVFRLKLVKITQNRPKLSYLNKIAQNHLKSAKIDFLIKIGQNQPKSPKIEFSFQNWSKSPKMEFFLTKLVKITQNRQKFCLWFGHPWGVKDRDLIK